MDGSFAGVPAGVPLLLRADKDGVKILVHPNIGTGMARHDAATLDPNVGKLLASLDYSWLDRVEYDAGHAALFVRDGQQGRHSIAIYTQRGAAIQRAVEQRRTVALSLQWDSTEEQEPSQRRRRASAPLAAPAASPTATTHSTTPTAPTQSFPREGQLRAQWLGFTPSGVEVGICVDNRGLALLNPPDSGTIIAFYDLFVISGWGATNEKLHLVVAADATTGREQTIEIWTQFGRDVIGELKWHATQMVAQVQGAQAPTNDCVRPQASADGPTSPVDSLPAREHGSPQLGDDQYLGDDDEMQLGDIGFEMPDDGLVAPTQDGLYDTNVDDLSLPDGWTKEFSKSSGDYYFFNAHTGESIWEHPLAGQLRQVLQAEPQQQQQQQQQQSTRTKLMGSKAGATEAATAAVDVTAPANWTTEVISEGHVELRGHSDTVHAVWAFDADEAGQLVASGSGDSSVRIWFIDSGDTGAPLVEKVSTLTGHTGAVRSLRGVDHRPQYQRWLASGAGDNLIMIWVEGSACDWNLVATLSGHVDDVTALDVVDKTLVSGDDSGSIRVWNAGIGAKSFLDTGPAKYDVSDWQCTAVLGAGKGRWISALTSIDSSAVASCEDDGIIRIWGVPIPDPNSMNDLELVTDPKPLYMLEGHKSCVWALDSYDWHGETKLLASASSDKTIRLWNRQTLVENIEHDDSQPVWSCALTVRGAHIRRSVPHALALIDDAVELSDVWDPQLAFNGLKIVTGGSDGRITVWALKYEHQEGLDWWDCERLATVSLCHTGSGCVSAVLPVLQDGVVACGHSESLSFFNFDMAEIVSIKPSAASPCSMEQDLEQHPVMPSTNHVVSDAVAHGNKINVIADTIEIDVAGASFISKDANALALIDAELAKIEEAEMQAGVVAVSAHKSSGEAAQISDQTVAHVQGPTTPRYSIQDTTQVVPQAASMAQISSDSESVSSEDGGESDSPRHTLSKTQLTIPNLPLLPLKGSPGSGLLARDVDTSSEEEVEVMPPAPIAVARSNGENPLLPKLDFSRLKPPTDFEQLVPPLMTRGLDSQEEIHPNYSVEDSKFKDGGDHGGDHGSDHDSDEGAFGDGAQATQKIDTALPDLGKQPDGAPQLSPSLIPNGSHPTSDGASSPAESADESMSAAAVDAAATEESIVPKVGIVGGRTPVSSMALTREGDSSSSDETAPFPRLAGRQLQPDGSVASADTIAQLANLSLDSDSSSDDSGIDDSRRPPQLPSVAN